MRKAASILFLAVVVLAMVACARSHTQLLQAHLEENLAGKPVRDVLVIVVTDNQEVRTVFEKHFVDWFEALCVDAITSVDVLPISDATKLEKADIVAAIDKYENDTIVITHLVGIEESEVFSRDRPQYYYNYYGFYHYAWGYVTWPTIYGERVQFNLETRLYDVKTESLIWAGEIQAVNPKTTGEAIGHVVETVMKELDKNGLLPERTS